MTDFFAGLFPMIFIYYLMYFFHFIFALIPIFSQMIFLNFFKFENLKIIYIVIFLIEGILIAFSNALVEVFLDSYSTDIFTILIIIFLLLILLVISYILSKRENKMNFKKTLIILIKLYFKYTNISCFNIEI